MEIKGTLKQITTPIGGTSKAGKDWVKAYAILESEGQYPKTIAVTLMSEALITQANSIKLNTTVSFDVNIESREFNGNYSTDLKAWRVN